MPPAPNPSALPPLEIGTYEQEVLNWICWDKTSVIAWLVRTTLEAWALTRELKVHQLSPERQKLGVELVGLSVWAAWIDSDVESISLSIAKQRLTTPKTIQLVYTAEPSVDQQANLVQAGAHYVVYPLSDLPRAVEIVARKIPTQQQSTNLLTQGLLQRLKQEP